MKSTISDMDMMTKWIKVNIRASRTVQKTTSLAMKHLKPGKDNAYVTSPYNNIQDLKTCIVSCHNEDIISIYCPASSGISSPGVTDVDQQPCRNSLILGRTKHF